MMENRHNYFTLIGTTGLIVLCFCIAFHVGDPWLLLHKRIENNHSNHGIRSKTFSSQLNYTITRIFGTTLQTNEQRGHWMKKPLRMSMNWKFGIIALSLHATQKQKLNNEETDQKKRFINLLSFFFVLLIKYFRLYNKIPSQRKE